MSEIDTKASLLRIEHMTAGGPPDLSKWTWADLMALGSVVFATHDVASKRDDLASVKGAVTLAREVINELAKRPQWQPEPDRVSLYRWIRDCAKAYRIGRDA